MAQKKYDLAVAYRIYPGIAKKMALYNEDKLKFSEFCLKSFKSSLGSLKIKIWVILDNCPPEYTKLFEKYFNSEDLILIPLNGVGNQTTFGKQIEILTTQNDAELVYFAEDDYFFLPNQFELLIQLIKTNPDVHFVSVYEHPDYYTLDLHNHKYQTKDFAQRHWRTAISTTCSFLTRKEILNKTAKVFNTYFKDKNYDVSIWMSLTKFNVLNPIRIIKYYFTYRDFWKMIARSWLHCWKQILFGKTWKLWVPMPSIGTHMEKSFLAPSIDWQNEFEKAKEI